MRKPKNLQKKVVKMLIKSKFQIRLEAPPNLTNVEINLYCSRWVANKAFISLCYALFRGDIWEKVKLVKIDKVAETVMNSCDLKKSMKFLRGHDGGKL